MLNNKLYLLIARTLMSAIFILSGLNKITGYAGTKQYMASVGLPLVDVLLVATIVLEVVGGAFLLIGYKTEYAAVALAGFTGLAAIIFHSNLADQTQFIMFMKNLAITGGLLATASTASVVVENLQEQKIAA